MARSFKISKKLYHLEKLLSDCVFGALEVTDIVINGQSHPEHMVERKIDAFDLIFDLSLDEQAKLFEYRAFKARAREGIWEKYDVDQLAEALVSDPHHVLTDSVEHDDRVVDRITHDREKGRDRREVHFLLQ